MRSIDLRPPWAFSRERWHVLTTGDALFRHLSADDGRAWALDADWFDDADDRGTGTLSGVCRWWKASYVDRCSSVEKSEAVRRWKVLGRVLWSFEQARKARRAAGELRQVVERTLPDFDEGGISRFEGYASMRGSDIGGVYMWIRTFSGAEPSGRVEVPVALYDRANRVGFLATLELEVLTGGVGEVAPHPVSAFDTIYHDTFDDSMRRAWTMALTTVSGPRDVDGRWRLRRGAPFRMSKSQPLELEAVDGASASGAAARGWWHALHGNVPDAEVVVLAQVSGDGQSFETVSCIAEKIQAIVREGMKSDGAQAFDTIVVADRAQGDAAGHMLAESASQLRLASLA